MANSIIYTDEFGRDVKKFLKKFPSLEEELLAFEDNLIQNPFLGTSLGAGLYKVRLATKANQKVKVEDLE